MGFGARAKVLVTDQDVKQKKLAEYVGISPAKMSNYLNEKNEMPCRVLVGIAQYFHVSSDYLLGLTDRPEPPMELSREERELVARFRGLRPDQRELVMKTLAFMGEQNRKE